MKSVTGGTAQATAEGTVATFATRTEARAVAERLEMMGRDHAVDGARIVLPAGAGSVSLSVAALEAGVTLRWRR